MLYELRFSRSAEDDLASLRIHLRRLAMAAAAEQLSHEPNKQTRNRRRLRPSTAGRQLPAWELRAGPLRIFYDIDEEMRVVTIVAVRMKPASKTTEEILE